MWWPDGKQISYTRIGPNRNQQVWTVPVAGGTSRLLDTLIFTGSNYPFDISRDGKRVLTSRSESVSREIWLLRARQSGRPWPADLIVLVNTPHRPGR